MAGSVALLPREIHVLDLGAGDFRRLKELAAKHPKKNFVGVDLYPRGGKLPVNVFPVKGNVVDFLLEMPGSSVRIANMDYCVHQLPAGNRLGFFKQLLRVVKPGGRVYVTEHINGRYSIAELVSQAKAAGFVHSSSKRLLFLPEGVSHSSFTAIHALGTPTANRYSNVPSDAPVVPTSARVTFVKPKLPKVNLP